MLLKHWKFRKGVRQQIDTKPRNTIDVSFADNDHFSEDGRELSIPLEWFPRLRYSLG